jgi:hypothetical protein
MAIDTELVRFARLADLAILQIDDLRRSGGSLPGLAEEVLHNIQVRRVANCTLSGFVTVCNTCFNFSGHERTRHLVSDRNSDLHLLTQLESITTTFNTAPRLHRPVRSWQPHWCVHAVRPQESGWAGRPSTICCGWQQAWREHSALLMHMPCCQYDLRAPVAFCCELLHCVRPVRC